MRIGIGSDHGGFNLKGKIINHLKENGYNIRDFGTHNIESVDYPEFAREVAEAVKSGECDRGILVCGTGLGMSIAANKIPGIRAAVCTNTYMARMSRRHNDANVLALGERILGFDIAIDIVKVWLRSEFLGERHTNRIDKINKIEKEYNK
ncbi:MAG: ribose 5-phosphate isomerase B [Clostridium sp.]|nr:ribose 5-phosphate isomerase B [Clostridium sp.]